MLQWIMIVSALLSLFKVGLLTMAELAPIFDRYKALSPTPETEQALKNELLDLAKRTMPTLDPAVMAQLKADGIDPAELGL